jgi:hypothetical protein
MKMPGNHSQFNMLLKVHLLGGMTCVLIAGSAVYFAGQSISNRRGLFLSARHELERTRAELNDTINQRASLMMRVQTLEQLTADQPELTSVKMLNTRTADIVAIAESVDMLVDSLQPLDRITDKRVPVQPLEFRGTANAENVFAFLGLLGERMPDIHVQSIDLIKDSIDTSDVRVVCMLYWFNDPAGVDE